MMHSDNLLCCREINRFSLLFSGRHQDCSFTIFPFFCVWMPQICAQVVYSMEVASWIHSRIFNLQHIFDNVRTCNLSTMLIGSMNFQQIQDRYFFCHQSFVNGVGHHYFSIGLGTVGELVSVFMCQYFLMSSQFFFGGFVVVVVVSVDCHLLFLISGSMLSFFLQNLYLFDLNYAR